MKFTSAIFPILKLKLYLDEKGLCVFLIGLIRIQLGCRIPWLLSACPLCSPLERKQLGFSSAPFRDNRAVFFHNSTEPSSSAAAVRRHGFICICHNASSDRSVCRAASTGPMLIRAECSCEPGGPGSAWKEETNPGTHVFYVEKHPRLIAFPHASSN